MADGLTTVEMIGIAIRSEEEAAEFYGAVSKRIKNDLVRAKYESLAREEVAHRQMLLNLYNKMTGEEKPPKIPGAPVTAEGGGVPNDVEELEELLNIAIERERKAQQFYREMAKASTDVNARRTALYLADVERGHEIMMESELKSYRRDRDWYADHSDIQLV